MKSVLLKISISIFLMLWIISVINIKSATTNNIAGNGIIIPTNNMITIDLTEQLKQYKQIKIDTLKEALELANNYHQTGIVDYCAALNKLIEKLEKDQ